MSSEVQPDPQQPIPSSEAGEQSHHGVVIERVAPAPSEEYQGITVPRAHIEFTSNQRTTQPSSYYRVSPQRQGVDVTLIPDRRGILHAVHPLQTWREEFWHDQPEDSYRREASGSHAHLDRQVYLHVWGDDKIDHEVCAEDPTRALGLRTSYWSDRVVLKQLEKGSNRELFERAKELIKDLEARRPFPTEPGSSWTDVVVDSMAGPLSVHVHLGDEQDPSKRARQALVAWTEYGELQWDLTALRPFPAVARAILQDIRQEGTDLVIQSRDR